MNNFLYQNVSKSSFYTLPKLLTAWPTQFCVISHSNLFISKLACTTFTNPNFLVEGLVPSLPLLAVGYMYVGQGSTIGFVGSLIFFQDFLFLLRWFFGQMESMDVSGVLQEAGDADLRVCTRSQVWNEYNIIPYTSAPITLSHLCQGYLGHCIFTSRWFIYFRVWVGEQGVGIIFFLIFVLFSCCC